MRVDGLDADAFDVRVTGAGDVAAAGRAQRVTLDISGAGDADLAELAADDARVELSGAGDAEVSAAHVLDAEVSGAGDLAYFGEPRVRQALTGDGEIEHRRGI